MKYTPVLCLVLMYAVVIGAAWGVSSCIKRAKVTANRPSTGEVTLEAGDGRLSPGGAGGPVTLSDLMVTASDGRHITLAGGRWRNGAGRELTDAEAGRFIRENIRRLECLEKSVQNEAR